MRTERAWIDREGKSYTMDEISNKHLLNILRFMCNGGGYTYFLSKERIKDLFNEADRRRLTHRSCLTGAINSIEIKGLKEYHDEQILGDDNDWF